jgi:peptidoglycan/xylan/chitin deacetylase (PgdA/CDA1 family)
VAVALAAGMRRLRRRRSVILAYHGIGQVHPPEDPDFLVVPQRRFRRQVELLLDAGFRFVTVAELAQEAAGGTPPPGLAALSFDDGMEDNHSRALPLLREWGIPATVFVATSLIGMPNPWVRKARMMTEDELRELAAAGVELGAHTVTHPDLATLDHDGCLREMTQSRRALEELTGGPVRTFAYPFCSYGPAAVAAARDAGFLAAVTCAGRGSWAPHEMKRVTITSKDGMLSFVLKLAELYQPLFDSPPGKAFRVATRGVRRRLRERAATGG